ncbi:MAG: hypothetical protein L0H38_02630 [bacterium]|nr:hypothetical protein [bacterium]
MTHIANADILKPQLAEKLSQQVKPALRYALGIAATAALTFMADAGAGYINRRRNYTPASVRTDLHEGDHTTYTLPGCRTDGEVVGDMLEPQLAKLGNTHNLSYGEGKIEIDSVKQHLLEARQADNGERASVIAMSMGGLVVAEAFRDPEFAEKFGPIDSLILDSSPSGIEDIKPSSRRAIRAASTLRSSYSVSKISSWAMLQRAIRNGEASHDEHVTDEQTMQHLKTTANVSLNTVHNQAKFIEASTVPERSLEHLDINRIYYISSENDPVVQTEQSVKAYEAAFGRKIIHIIDSSRPEKSHAVIPEYQEMPNMLLKSTQQDLALA